MPTTSMVASQQSSRLLAADKCAVLRAELTARVRAWDKENKLEKEREAQAASAAAAQAAAEAAEARTAMRQQLAASIAAMKEIIDMKQIKLEYIGTKKMRADILTKGFASRAVWDNTRTMIMTGKREEIEP